jgi:hypothetical protein
MTFALWLRSCLRRKIAPSCSQTMPYAQHIIKGELLLRREEIVAGILFVCPRPRTRVLHLAYEAKSKTSAFSTPYRLRILLAATTYLLRRLYEGL